MGRQCGPGGEAGGFASLADFNSMGHAMGLGRDLTRPNNETLA